ncbi:IQ and AAA domain-containing protein 1-like isoform X2 [Apis laboriosa]|uniref:IQ and AAA domain-containing protein 1-like isoform X2 n=1 Tax=Apis laboriosa TaxID=183418 RepID=UPI001CC3E500|nr:IQ and AAA domain-containing protein 1-like isoform X2 [Apis laboriosa]
MSHSYYTELWLISRNDLEKLIELDKKLQKTPRWKEEAEEAEIDVKHGLDLLLPVYLKYRNLVKRLIVCHDQMVQTQKRELIKRVLDCAVGRMLEYKQEIVNLNYNDHQWPDDFMKQLKYTPDDVEILVCAAVSVKDESKEPSEIDISELTPSQESIRLRRRRLREKTPTDEIPILYESPEKIAARKAERAMLEAVLLIQSHERARVARAIGQNVIQEQKYHKNVAMGLIIPKKIDKATYLNAVKTIQRAWRTYAAKKKLKNRIARTEELLGMTIPSWKNQEVFKKDKENFEKKLALMSVFADETAKATEKEQARLLKIKRPGLIEDITDEIREWFILWYDELGHFYVYPAAHLGGSVLIATGQTITPQEYLVEKKAKEMEKKAPEKVKKKKVKKKNNWMPETKAFSLLNEANQCYNYDWSHRYSNDFQQKIYHDLITDELCYKLQLETRKVVDELMRLELQKLNAALKKDYAADLRRFDVPIDKRRRRPPPRKKPPPSPDDFIEDFKELVRANIIKDYPSNSLNDWIGDRSYQNYEAILEFRNYKHRLGEVKQLVMEYCILPLSTKEIHQIAPLIQSVCICGLPHQGKSFLVNAICSEVGALLFDMSPSILAGKFMGPKNEHKLINTISKLARAYAPSVIFIDNSEKVWAKKVPVDEIYLKPKRFARYFPKMVKNIKKGDQILFLTTATEPYAATAPFMRIHNKFIIIPLTDYNTLYMFYKDELMKYYGIDRNIDVSSMAKVSVGIPLGYIKNTIQNILNLRRRITLKFKPLLATEIINEVLKYEPLPPKMVSQFEKFENRTPLGRKRLRMLAKEKALLERVKKLHK